MNASYRLNTCKSNGIGGGASSSPDALLYFVNIWNLVIGGSQLHRKRNATALYEVDIVKIFIKKSFRF